MAQVVMQPATGAKIFLSSSPATSKVRQGTFLGPQRETATEPLGWVAWACPRQGDRAVSHVLGAATLPTPSHPEHKRTEGIFYLPVEGGSCPLPAPCSAPAWFRVAHWPLKGPIECS